MPLHPIIVIPARLESNRLPGKPLADIHGEAMIVHVWRRAIDADIGPVVVACAEAEIAAAVEAAGGRAVLTRPDHASGSDRVFEAVETVDPDSRFDTVVNIQGDLPSVEPETVARVLDPLDDAAVDIATIVAPITDAAERDDPNVVKAAIAIADGARSGRCLYFSRVAVPSGEGLLLHHIGIYAFRRPSLARFIALPPGVLEKRERLEQLRALEDGMRIDAAVVDAVPLGVDTRADLEQARRLMASSEPS